ncbi:G-type lectin S-receptor-like serine/threonine-protein kinase B120 [Hibiscus syriacus]|uniref:G-type lectin S-receptor-like serine/threonine-protein kinase B120 n=1 Tax=Hibiscus syriacus TaxID=106335 RepID=UPI001923240D|nr:G-type lectin S-receptor-like serine/threonine-protein kinase B120 [Hibiscus syriacus]
MAFSRTWFLYPFILLMFSSHVTKYFEVAAMDTITPGIHLISSATIVSAGEMFELGFYQPANSVNYYVAIMYKNILEDRVVWIANRDYPVTASAFFCIGKDGNLAIRQGRIIYMVTDLNLTNANVSATLLDSGNLVLRDENSSILWQSFDYPSHTFLPGMKLGYDTMIGKTWSYVSWRSSNDPSPGNFTFQLDPGKEKRLVILNGDQIYWRSIRPWGDDSSFFEFPPEARMNMYNFTFVSESDAAYLTYTLYRNDIISRFTLDATGQLRQVLWLENEWSLLNSQPRQPCDVYAYCGANSSCSNVSSPFCSCLPGFEPSSAELWSNGDFKEGCNRKNDLQCGMEGPGTTEDGFHEISNVKLPRNQLPLEVQSIGECRSTCLNNCSCSGFSYTDQNCSIWSGDLINLQQLPADGISGTTFYLRLSTSDLGTNRSTNNIRRAIIVSVTISMTVFGSALFIWQVKKKREDRKGQDLLTFDITMSPARSEKKPAKQRRQVEHEKEVEIPLFSFSSVSAATDNFSFSNKLGEGGFGPVYKGKLLKGEEVAVKRLSRKSRQGWDELKNEAMLIAKLQHKNLVKLLGCCIEGDENILIYEYLPNKSLDSFLFGTNAIFVLPWETRVRIIEGIAQGLLYLHQYSRVQIIHRDLKASNVLLDKDMNPKISDFGMARIFGGTEQRATNRIVGTYGYMAPEYALEGVFSVKSDVFSFGVLLLEILSGKKNTGLYLTNSLNLIGYAWDLWTSNKPLELMDIDLQDKCCPNAATRYINTALLCVEDRASNRPTMSNVFMMLNNELAILPSPVRPAFSNVRSGLESSQSIPEISQNKLTVSVVVPR